MLTAVRFFLLSFVLSSLGVHAISPTMAYVGASIPSLLAGLITYRVSNYNSKAAIVAAGIGGSLGYWCLNKYTPKGRIKRAENALNTARNYWLVAKPLPKQAQLFSDISKKYSTYDWPLIAAVTELRSYEMLTVEAAVLGDTAWEEDASLKSRADRVMSGVKMCLIDINNALYMICSSKEFHIQMEQFHKKINQRE